MKKIITKKAQDMRPEIFNTKPSRSLQDVKATCQTIRDMLSSVEMKASALLEHGDLADYNEIAEGIMEAHDIVANIDIDIELDEPDSEQALRAEYDRDRTMDDRAERQL